MWVDSNLKDGFDKDCFLHFWRVGKYCLLHFPLHHLPIWGHHLVFDWFLSWFIVIRSPISCSRVNLNYIQPSWQNKHHFDGVIMADSCLLTGDMLGSQLGWPYCLLVAPFCILPTTSVYFLVTNSDMGSLVLCSVKVFNNYLQASNPLMVFVSFSHMCMSVHVCTHVSKPWNWLLSPVMVSNDSGEGCVFNEPIQISDAAAS